MLWFLALKSTQLEHNIGDEDGFVDYQQQINIEFIFVSIIYN
jgi:hypothetical protein